VDGVCTPPILVCVPEDYNGDDAGCGTPPILVCIPEDYNGDAAGCGTPPVDEPPTIIERVVAAFVALIPVTGGEIQDITAGTAHTCVITSDGGVQCWGSNTYGQLGNGANQESNVPVDVAVLGSATKIVAGGNHTCALVGSEVWCWGQNSVGQIGDGSQINRNKPVKVLSGAKDIMGGLDYTCAEMQDGTVMCWGNNAEGQFAADAPAVQTTPILAKLYTGHSNFSTAQDQTCSLTETGLVSCSSAGTPLIPVTGGVDLGNLEVAVNRFSTTGIGLADGGVPVVLQQGETKLLSELTNVVDVDSGVSHSCALESNGSVKCWGSNTYGQLGNNSSTNSLTPASVSGLAGVTQMTVGKNHACVVTGPNTVECWGLNINGQLGTGTNKNSLVPVEVKFK
jgi:alpha-tubulin suppressor-like RCC1 family protein